MIHVIKKVSDREWGCWGVGGIATLGRMPMEGGANPRGKEQGRGDCRSLPLQGSHGESMAGMLETQEGHVARAQWASRERQRWLEESASVGG